MPARPSDKDDSSHPSPAAAATDRAPSSAASPYRSSPKCRYPSSRARTIPAAPLYNVGSSSSTSGLPVHARPAPHPRAPASSHSSAFWASSEASGPVSPILLSLPRQRHALPWPSGASPDSSNHAATRQPASRLVTLRDEMPVPGQSPGSSRPCLGQADLNRPEPSPRTSPRHREHRRRVSARPVRSGPRPRRLGTPRPPSRCRPPWRRNGGAGDGMPRRIKIILTFSDSSGLTHADIGI
jgi:hypothetical protein